MKINGKKLGKVIYYGVTKLLNWIENVINIKAIIKPFEINFGENVFARGEWTNVFTDIVIY